ncbi:MAG: DUF362 domain-containing protein [Nanoarchaeota archaeon]|nr:DUF362 domain-containing protein [Nanoarchaeota archaeon]
MKVSVVKCSTYDEEKVYAAVKKSIDLLGGIDKFVKKGQKVLIKPNLLMAAKPNKHVTTHPAVVGAIVRLVNQCGATATIGDNPFGTKFDTLVDKTGMKKVADRYGANLSSLYKKKRAHKQFTLCGDVFDYDAVINVPKLKTHVLTKFTGAVKNLYGLIFGMTKFKHHVKHKNPVNFSKNVLDLHHIFKDKIVLNIMDGIVGMDGNGPSGGNLRHTNIIMASSDALCMDKVACDLVSLDRVPLLQHATIPKISVVGDKVKPIKFKSPNTYKRIMLFVTFQRHFMDRPVIVEKKCISCMQCIRACSVNTIVKVKKGKRTYPFIVDRKCIRCYCCHEHCPEKAITLKKGKLRHLVRIKAWFHTT